MPVKRQGTGAKSPGPKGGRLLSNDEAKAAQELAKLGCKALDIVSNTGGYLRDVLGQLPHDAVGILGDMVRRTRDRLADKAAEEIKDRGIREPVPPSLSVLLPLVALAEREDREDLQHLWAGLLATAMEPGRQGLVRREFFKLINELEPLDALVLGSFRVPEQGHHVLSRHRNQWQKRVVAEWGSTSERLSVSLDHLIERKLIQEYSGSIELSPLGTTLLEACLPSGS